MEKGNKKKVKKSPEEMNDVCEYIFHDPFRFVKEYEHTFSTFAKQRWLGKPLYNTLIDEFKAYSNEYFKKVLTYN